MKRLLVSCAALVALPSFADLTPMDWHDGDLDVPVDSELTISGASCTNTKLTVSGTLNIDMSSEKTIYYVLSGDLANPSETSIKGSTVTVAPNPGDNAAVNVIKGQFWGRWSNWMYTSLHFGKSDGSESGFGRMVLGGHAGYTQYEHDFNLIYFNAGLKPQNPNDEVVDAITIDHLNALVTYSIYQRCTTPVRITFTNSLGTAAQGQESTLGYGRIQIFYGSNLFALTQPGSDLILRGYGKFGSTASAPIVFDYWSGTQCRLFRTEAQNLKACVRTEGDCDFVFNPSSTGNGVACAWHEFNGTNVYWGHTGDFIVPNTGNYNIGIRTTVSGVLPNGPQTGLVRVEAGASNANKQFIDLYGTTQCVNGLKLLYGGKLTNMADTVASLVLGKGDVDALLTSGAGTIAPTIALSKIGSGKLTLSAANADAMTVTDGDVEAAGESRIGNLVFAGADQHLTLNAGATLVCDSLVYTGRVTVATGARLTVVDRSKCLITGFDLACADTQPKVVPFDFQKDCSYMLETFNKTGKAIASMTIDRVPQGPVNVAEGTLRIVPSACGDKYWRFVFKKTTGTVQQYGTSAPYRKQDGAEPAIVHLVLGKLHLLDADGNIVNLSSSYKSTTAATALVAGSHAFTHEFFNTRNKEYGAGAEWNSGAYVAQDMGSWWSATAFTNQNLVADDPSTWETITFRLKDNAAGIAGYMMSEGSNAQSPYADPKTWTLESSPDANTWTVRDSHVDDAPTHYGTGDADYFNKNKPFVLNQVVSATAFTNAVTVANGATLDLSPLGDGKVSVPSLTVDMTAGGGTLVAFAPAANGTINLVNVPASAYDHGALKGRLDIPLTFVSPSATGNFANWTVQIDGVETRDSTLVWTGTALQLRTPRGGLRSGGGLWRGQGSHRQCGCVRRRWSARSCAIRTSGGASRSTRRCRPSSMRPTRRRTARVRFRSSMRRTKSAAARLSSRTVRRATSRSHPARSRSRAGSDRSREGSSLS